MVFLLVVITFQVTKFANEFIKYKEDGRLGGGDARQTASAARAGNGVGKATGGSNSSSADFMTAGKKKKATGSAPQSK